MVQRYRLKSAAQQQVPKPARRVHMTVWEPWTASVGLARDPNSCIERRGREHHKDGFAGWAEDSDRFPDCDGWVG